MVGTGWEGRLLVVQLGLAETMEALRAELAQAAEAGPESPQFFDKLLRTADRQHKLTRADHNADPATPADAMSDPRTRDTMI
jgi:hypothetical protein